VNGLDQPERARIRPRSKKERCANW